MALRELRLRVPRSLIIEVVALPLPLRSAVEGARYCEICFQIGLVSLILRHFSFFHMAIPKKRGLDTIFPEVESMISPTIHGSKFHLRTHQKA
jgi:hypothetical protein